MSSPKPKGHRPKERRAPTQEPKGNRTQRRLPRRGRADDKQHKEHEKHAEDSALPDGGRAVLVVDEQGVVHELGLLGLTREGRDWTESDSFALPSLAPTSENAFE